MATRAEEGELKYLEFVLKAAFRAAMCSLKFYSYAKDWSGPLKFGVEAMEGTVKSVVGPLYIKLHDPSKEVLKFVDRKVDESVTTIDRLLPLMVKQVSSQAISTALQTPEVARNLASEIQRTGLKGTVSGIVKSVYTKYEPKVEQSAASAMHTLNQLPVFPTVAQAIVPTAALYTEKYN
ncbi:REF/SRPP-like protein At3g05500 [Cucurbita maxima]|uniref:REF/SRPP-like protein At3g05500 n=1 Tax=Cucurbita maxima TaxID=3661 RepID=A0A6J1HUI5_CUCMA|nr:REF/SRPP-like protein At3g05500 [Cucurbita maxima]